METVRDEELLLPQLHHQQKAVLSSLRNHWDGLQVFADNPVIPMDNNGSERTLRNPVVGRKNYYGSGTIGSSRLTAMMFTPVLAMEQANTYPKYPQIRARAEDPAESSTPARSTSQSLLSVLVIPDWRTNFSPERNRD
jgi:hypothetical protein